MPQSEIRKIRGVMTSNLRAAGPPGEPLDEDDESFLIELEQPAKSTTVGSQILLQSKDTSGGGVIGAIFANMSVLETLLLIVCGFCLLTLALSIAYFYVIKKMGKFSDNPWYRRRMYYAMSSVSHVQNPARCFNLYQRERPNTLSLSGAVTTPPTVIVPVPMMDAAVGDDKIYEKKSKTNKGGGKSSKLRASESTTKRGPGMNAVGPVGVTRKSSSHRKREKISSKYAHTNPTMIDMDRGESSDDSGAYVTPPQDQVGGVISLRKEKNPYSGGGRKK